MTEPHWKHLADTLETRQGLRWAFIEVRLELRRLKALAPLDYEELLNELMEEKIRLPAAHRQSA